MTEEPLKIEYGGCFKVYVYKDHVVKVLKKPEKQDDVVGYLDRIVEMQNYFAEHIEEILPCKRVGHTIEMPRVPGVKGTELDTETWEKIRYKAYAIRRKIEGLGYSPQNVSSKDNLFYDEESGKVYPVDFNLVKKLPEGG